MSNTKHSKVFTHEEGNQRKHPGSLKWIILTISLVAGIVIIWSLIVKGTDSNSKEIEKDLLLPEMVTEEGTYAIKLSDAINLPSIQSRIKFDDIQVGELNYDELSTTITFIFKIIVPNSESVDIYKNWLENFAINDSSILELSTFGHNDIKGGIFYTTYKVSGIATSGDDEYLLSCNVNDNLTLNFVYPHSFWELPGMDKDSAILYNQEKLDEEFGIELVNWDENANQKDYIQGNPYKMTGKILSSGQYFGELASAYYITLDAAYAFPGVDVHCYFTQEEWDNRPTFENGDLVTLYAYYDYWSLGWNFTGCSFSSLAGTYSIDSNGMPQILTCQETN